MRVLAKFAHLINLSEFDIKHILDLIYIARYKTDRG